MNAEGMNACKFMNKFLLGMEENPCGIFLQLLGSVMDETPKQLLHKHMHKRENKKTPDIYVGLRNVIMFLFSLLIISLNHDKDLFKLICCHF